MNFVRQQILDIIAHSWASSLVGGVLGGVLALWGFRLIYGPPVIVKRKEVDDPPTP